MPSSTLWPGIKKSSSKKTQLKIQTSDWLNCNNYYAESYFTLSGNELENTKANNLQEFNSKDPDQPAHTCSLVKESYIHTLFLEFA